MTQATLGLQVNSSKKWSPKPLLRNDENGVQKMISLFAKMVVAKVAIPKVKVLRPKVDLKGTRRESGKNFLTNIKSFKKKII